MKLFYFKCAYGNFGDDLNEWFWDQVLPGWQEWDPETYLVGIGSILNRQIPQHGRKLVIGTGSGYGLLPDVQGPQWDIRGVRGPLTCGRLNLSRDLALSDPAILLPTLPPFREISKSNEILFIPHIDSDKLCDWREVCSKLGISYQSPSDPFMDVIKRISRADRVIAESMHAAIIADAFDVPWKAVALSRAFNDFKWNDWAQSLDMKTLEIQRFFRVLRSIQKIGSFVEPSPKASLHSANTTAGARSPKQSARRPYLNWLAPQDLKRALNGDFVLTERDALKRQQEKLLDALEKVRVDYSTS